MDIYTHVNIDSKRETAETLTKAMAAVQAEPNSSAAYFKRHWSVELDGYSSVREPRRPSLMKLPV